MIPPDRQLRNLQIADFAIVIGLLVVFNTYDVPGWAFALTCAFGIWNYWQGVRIYLLKQTIEAMKRSNKHGN